MAALVTKLGIRLPSLKITVLARLLVKLNPFLKSVTVELTAKNTQSPSKALFLWQTIDSLGARVAENLRFNLDVDTGSAVSSINQFFNTFDQGAAKAQQELNKAFGQKYETEVNISMKGGKVAASMIKKIGTDSDRLSTTIKGINGQFGKTPAQIKRSLNSLKALRENTRKFSQTTGKVSKDWQLVTQRIKEAERELKGFYAIRPSAGGSGGAGGAQSMGAAFTAAGIKARLASEAIMAASRAIQGAIQGMVDRSRELGRLSIALQSFSRDAQQAQDIMKAAQTTGLAYGVSIQSVENAWRRVGPSAAAAGLSLGETNELITAATARMSQMGLSAEQSGRYMEALAQVMGKGKLQGEELRQQFAELDGALRTQVASFLQANYGIISLDDAMQNGEVSAKMFAEAMISISKDAVENLVTDLGNLNDQFDKLNLEQKFNNLNNVATIAKQKWGEVFGPFGESMMRIATLVTGFLANFTTRFPTLSRNITQSLRVIGEVAEMVVYGLIFLFDILLKLYEKWNNSNNMFIKGIRMAINPVGELINMFGAKGEGSGDNWWTQSVKNARTLMGEMGSMKTIFEESLEKQQEGLAAQESGTDEARAMNEQLEAQKQKVADITQKEEEATEQAKLKKEEISKQKEKVNELAASIKLRYDNEIEAQKRVSEAKKQALKDEKDSYKQAKEAVKSRYDAEIQRVTEVYDKKLAAMGLEADRLNARTPSEQKLYDLEKKALQEKIKSGSLDDEELLRAQARLERMERQEQLQKLSVERKEVEKQKAADIKTLEEQRDDKLEKMEEKHEKIIKSLEAQLKKSQDQVKALQDAKKEVGNIKKDTEAYTDDLDEGLTRLKGQVEQLATMEKQWTQLKDEAKQYASILEKANSDKASLQKKVDAATPALEAKASGGPVSGGSTYQVNELGKEAFLSAAGKLSMINAPSYGKWKAPSSGTVIPAHLTKQLSIPTGGINVNGAAASNASRAGSSGMGGVVKAIRASMGGGDTISNNVTIQTSKPIQAASDIMVQMNKVRRRRYT